MKEIKQLSKDEIKGKLTRVLIYGSALTGKTTLAGKFADNIDRIMFVSTDGNAALQGYKGIDVEFYTELPNGTIQWNNIRSELEQVFNYLRKHRDEYDVIVFDLLEDWSEYYQQASRDKNSDDKVQIQDWGDIKSIYQAINVQSKSLAKDKTIIYLCREEDDVVETTEYGANGKPKTIRKVVGTKPALRKQEQNSVLKDPDAQIRTSFRGKNRLVQIESLRYEEQRERLEKILGIDKQAKSGGAKFDPLS